MRNICSTVRGWSTAFACLGVLMLGPAPAQAGDSLVIVGATVIPGTGAEPMEDTAVYIRNGIIERIETLPDGNYPQGPGVLEAHGKFLVPGLVESHAHIDHVNGIGLTAEQKEIARAYNPLAFLYNGVTTVISMSSHDLGWVQDQQRRARQGAILPRIFTGGEHFTFPGGWGGRHGGGVTSEAEVAARMEKLIASGVDLVKIIYENGLGEDPVFDRLPTGLMAEVVRLARQNDLPVFIHATDGAEYAQAIATAPDAIVHGLLTPLAPDRAMVEQLRENNIQVVPTIVLFEAFIRFLDSPELLEDRHLKASVPDFVRASVSDPDRLSQALAQMNRILKMDAAAWARTTLDQLKENTRTFAAAGIPLAVGSDSGGAVAHAFQGYNTPREMEILADCCLSPMATLVAASRNGARMIGRDGEFGTIAPGKAADILILNSNPLTHMGNIRDFDNMIVRGKPVARASLTFDAFLNARQTETGNNP